MRLELARSAGFCYGVRRAVELAELAADREKPCYMLGPVIHNDHVTAHLEEDVYKRQSHGCGCLWRRQRNTWYGNSTFGEQF